MSHDGREIANFVLDYCDRIGQPVSNLALQKIVFFCHVWSLVDHRRPLVRHHFEAWKHGPVLQYLYREFKEFGDDPIEKRATRVDKMTGKRETADYTFDKETEELLNRVVAFYGRLSASQLRKISHVPGGPWERAWNHDGNVNPGMKLENENISNFYSKHPPPFTLQ